MQYPWTEFFQLGLVVSAFFPEVRERKGPVLEVTRKLAADPFFQGREHQDWLMRAEEKRLTGRQLNTVTLHAARVTTIQPCRLPPKLAFGFLRAHLARHRQEKLE